MRRSVIGITVLSALWAFFGVGCDGGEGVLGGRRDVLPTSRIPEANVLEQAQLQYYWQMRLPLEAGEQLARIDRLAEHVYCLTSRNRLVAVDAARGLIKWHYQADPAQTVFPPALANGVKLAERSMEVKEAPAKAGEIAGEWDIVLISTLTEALVLDRKTGRLLRRIPFDFSANTGCATDGEYLYVGATNGWCYVLRLADGVKMWWAKTEAVIMAPPIVQGKSPAGRLYVASADGGLYVLETGDRSRLLWSTRDKGTRAMHGPVTAAFHVDSRACFVPCEDNRVYAYELSGAPLWNPPFTCQGPLRDAVQVGENTVFQYASGDKFYAIDLVKGKQRWALPEGRKALMTLGPDVYLLGKDERLLVVDEILGSVKASAPVTGLDLFVGNVTASVIYAGTRDGRIVCIRDRSAGHLTVEMLREGREIKEVTKP